MENILSELNKDSLRTFYSSTEKGIRGPFEFEAIVAQINQGLLGEEDMLWDSETETWSPLNQIKDLYDTFKDYNNKKLASATPDLLQPTFDFGLVEEEVSRIEKELHIKNEPQAVTPKANGSTSKHSKKYWGILITSVWGLLLLFLPYKYFSAPDLTQFNLSQEDRYIFQSILKPSSSLKSPSIALGLDQGNKITPTLYIASHSEKPLDVEIFIQGVRGTLIGTESLQIQQKLTLQKDITKFGPIFRPEGTALPAGNYLISVNCTQNCGEVTQKLIAQKEFFLGGVKDQNYEANLVRYHAGLREKAKNELLEFGQIIESIDQQLQKIEPTINTCLNYNSCHESLAGSFTREAAFMSQVDEVVKGWTAKDKAKNIFYGELFAEIQGAHSSLLRIASETFHRTQKTTISSEQKISNIKQELKSLIAKLDQAKILYKQMTGLPLSVNGMPQKK